MSIRPIIIRRKLHRNTAFFFRAFNCPQHHLSPNPLTAQFLGNTDRFDSATLASLKADRWSECKLKRANDRSIHLGNDQFIIRICFDLAKRADITLRQRIFKPLTMLPKKIGSKHANDFRKVFKRGLA